MYQIIALSQFCKQRITVYFTIPRYHSMGLILHVFRIQKYAEVLFVESLEI